MIRYFKLFFTFAKNNLTRAMEYRSNFFMSIILNIFWVSFQFWIILTLYQYTDSIAGWSKNETIVLYGIFRLTKGFFDMFIRKNLFDFPNSISSGDLDYSLTKPVNTLFLTSLRYHLLTEASTLISGAVIFVYSLTLFNFQLDAFLVFRVIVSVFVAFTAYYSFLTFLVTMSFFMTRFTAINELNTVISQSMRYPTSALSRGNKAIDFFLLPIAMIATYPAGVILNKFDPFGIVIELFVAVLMFTGMYYFWNFALKRYSSASS